MTMKNWIVSTAASTSLAMTVSVSFAASVTKPGEQIGLSGGMPLPEGVVVAVDTFTIGRADYSHAPDVMGNNPFLIWSSPYKIFGAQIEPILAMPTGIVNTHNPAPLPNATASFSYNPFVASVFAWNLGGGLGISYLLGAYLPVGDRGSLGLGFAGTPLAPQLASTTIRQTFATTYIGDGSYNISASLTYGLTVDPHARFGGSVGRTLGAIPHADSLNLDLTMVKRFGKFEIGPVAYASTDLVVNRGDPLYRNYQRAGQIAVGGLVGYNFDRFILQTYVTRDVIARETVTRTGQRQANEETRGWLRIILPLYAPNLSQPGTPAPGPLVSKY